MKNKYSKILVLLTITVLILSFVSAIPTNNKAKEPLDKITFIHYKDGTMKAVGGNSRLPICYKLMGVKWGDLPVNYVINPTNSQDLSESFVTNAIFASAETWDAATSKELFNNGYGIDSSATWGIADYKNAYVFGTYSDNNVIAVTNIWYTRRDRQIVDYDVLFNTYYNWGDATLNPLLMDLQNIATHETGHGIGLADIYTTSCSAVTMFGYSGYGDISKRTLEKADITGLQKMYSA